MNQAIETVYDLDQRPQRLAGLLARGGEGEVYPLQDRPDVLLKRYHATELQKRGTALQSKVEAMRNLTVLRDNKEGLSWPLISAYDARQQWIGYCMYRAAGVPMFKLAHVMLYQKYFPGLDRHRLVAYLLNLVQQVQQLHRQQVMVGDYNLQNILCDPGSDRVTLIDCDSFQLQIAGKHYPCPVGSADLTPKEHQNQPFSQVLRTPESEAFSLAIVLFKALMLGRHPYDIVDGADPVQNLCSGHFPYGIGNKGIPKGPWYNIWSHMPYRLKELFIQTFTEGAEQPSRRATLVQWHEALHLYGKEMDKGWHDTHIKPAQPKAKTYRGSQSHAST